MRIIDAEKSHTSQYCIRIRTEYFRVRSYSLTIELKRNNKRLAHSAEHFHQRIEQTARGIRRYCAQSLQ